jgi:hypothetical protein
MACSSGVTQTYEKCFYFSLSLGYPSAGIMAKERKKREVRYSKKQNAHSHEHFIF